MAQIRAWAASLVLNENTLWVTGGWTGETALQSTELIQVVKSPSGKYKATSTPGPNLACGPCPAYTKRDVNCKQTGVF